MLNALWPLSCCAGWLPGWRASASAGVDVSSTAASVRMAGIATASAPASTSGQAAQQAKGKRAEGAASAKAAGRGSGAGSSANAAAEAVASSHFLPSRLGLYHRDILQRELALKLQPRSLADLPRLLRVEASILAIETVLHEETVEKERLLLYLLALEVLTGRPATFTSPPNKNLGLRATGVAVALDAQTDPEATFAFLEKLVHVILPNQVGRMRLHALT